MLKKINLLKTELVKKEIIKKIKSSLNELIDDFKKDKRERRRLIILAAASVVLLDYLMFCYHIEKNIFNIFPPIPVLKKTRSVDIYLPSFDDMSINVEKREIPDYTSEERLVKYFFYSVAKGSLYENTSLFVPLDFFVRNIWLLKSEQKNSPHKSWTCVIDVEPGILADNIVVIPGSEELFKKALGKTISQNLPEIHDIILAENGVPFKQLWDVKEK